MSYLIRISLTSRGRMSDPRCDCLRQARALFRRFHCFSAPELVSQPCRRLIPRVLVQLGELRGLIYRSDRGPCGCPRTFVHFLECPAQLACDSTGRQLYILGGNYRVTPRGIEG